MNILVILIPVSISLGALGLIGFIWTIRSRQYDDPIGQAARILLDSSPENAKPDQDTPPNPAPSH